MQQTQQMEELNEKGELIISEVIQRVKSNFTKFEKFMKNQKNKKVILLCGNTGAGKSTIYNWLLGAGFKTVEKDGLSQLEPIHTNDQMYISKMGKCSTSVTQTSIYDFIEELGHVLIDLPGFESTIDEYHKLFIDVLFQKITTSFQTKIVYVLDSPQRELHNRGKDLIQFINQQIGQNPLNIQNIFLIINKYLEDDADDVQIKRIKEQLEGRPEFKQGMLKKIQIIHKIKNNEMIQNVFSEQARKSLILNLNESESITLQNQTVSQLSSCEIVNSYLMQKSTFYFKRLTEMSQQIIAMIQKKHKFSLIPSKQEETNPNSRVPKTIAGLYTLYSYMITKETTGLNEDDEFHNFKKIYKYFLPYQQHLSCFSCMSVYEQGEVTRFNSVIDYLSQNSNSQPEMTDQVQRVQQQTSVGQTQNLQAAEKSQNKWINIIGDIFSVIVVVFGKVYCIYTDMKKL